MDSVTAGNILSPLKHLFENLLMPTAAFVVGVFLFWGVFKYFTAYGDPTKLEQAKKTLFWAIIGAAVIALSYVAITWIIRLVAVKEPFEPFFNIF